MIPVLSLIDVGAAVSYRDLLFDKGMKATTDCVVCRNTGLEDFKSILQLRTNNNFISGLRTRAVHIASELRKGEWVQGMTNQHIITASCDCSHS